MSVALPPASHVLRRAVQHCLSDLRGDELVLVACSGGPDSLALAAATAAGEHRAEAVVIDHQLQPTSAAVADEVRRQVESLGLPAQVRAVAVGSAKSAGGPEAAARAARYQALTEVARAQAATAVLLGHTRDDQAESVLLGLARGSGTRSLAGMPARRGLFRRPFLGMARSTIEESLTELHLTAWRDPHNEDPTFARVRVRNVLLPAMEAELGPGVAEALARTASLARDDADALDELAEQGRARVAAAQWDIDELLSLPRAVRTRVLRLAAFAHGSPRDAVTAGHIDEVDRLLTDWHGQGPLDLPGRVRVARRYGRLMWVRP